MLNADIHCLNDTSLTLAIDYYIDAARIGLAHNIIPLVRMLTSIISSCYSIVEIINRCYIYSRVGYKGTAPYTLYI